MSLQAREENVAIRAQEDLLLSAVGGDLSLEAASKKITAAAGGNVEIAASGATRVNGQNLQLNHPG